MLLFEQFRRQIIRSSITPTTDLVDCIQSRKSLEIAVTFRALRATILSVQRDQRLERIGRNGSAKNVPLKLFAGATGRTVARSLDTGESG